jgi:hypothetical protein
MTNSPAALRLLVVYAIIIPAAILTGYALTNPLDYGTVGFVGILLLLLTFPILIKWHYPIMVFCLAFPGICFFLPGQPSFGQMAVILSLCIAIVERTLSKEKQFLSAPIMTLALVFTIAMAVTTMELTGGFHLHAIGGGPGGGKKYINLYLGIAVFFVFISQGIPLAQRNLYISLFFLPGIVSFIGDLFPYLPPPLDYVNLLIPPTGVAATLEQGFGILRFSGTAAAANAVLLFMLARYGLRGILSTRHLVRLFLFLGFFGLAQVGGFRGHLFANVVIVTFAFFLEGLHRTRWMFLAVVIGFLGMGFTVAFSRDLPLSIQRSLSFLPLNIDPGVRADAEGSTEWRLAIWKAILPKVPEYLMLGKGYSLTSLDYESLGSDNPFAASAQANASLESLAISNDFHSGPLSTVVCFGIWGCISILAIMFAALYIAYHNYRYGDPLLGAVNTLFLAMVMEHIIHFFLIFGAYDNDVGWFARFAGLSVAFNWGVCQAKAKTAPAPVANPKVSPKPAGAPQPA